MRHFFLHSDRVRDLIEDRHMPHHALATELGISRAYWSLLLNRHRPLTKSVRRKILDCPVFAGVPEDVLWERSAPPTREGQ